MPGNSSNLLQRSDNQSSRATSLFPWQSLVRNTFIDIQPEPSISRQQSCPNLDLGIGRYSSLQDSQKINCVSTTLRAHDAEESGRPCPTMDAHMPAAARQQKAPESSSRGFNSGHGTQDAESDGSCSQAEDSTPNGLELTDILVTPRMGTSSCFQDECDFTPPPVKISVTELNDVAFKGTAAMHKQSLGSEWSQCDMGKERVPLDGLTNHDSIHCEKTSPEEYACAFPDGADYNNGCRISLSDALGPFRCSDAELNNQISWTTDHSYFQSLHPWEIHATSVSWLTPGHVHQNANVSIMLRGFPTRHSRGTKHFGETELLHFLEPVRTDLGDSPSIRLLYDERGIFIGAAAIDLTGVANAEQIATRVRRKLHQSYYESRRIDVILPGLGGIAPLPKFVS